MNATPQPGATLVHEALLYDGLDDYVAGTGAFVNAGLNAGEAVMVAVPAPHLGALHQGWGWSGEDVKTVDMTGLGQNPGRIIPAVRKFTDHHKSLGRRVRFVGEPIWPSRTRAETVEATRHEGLLNLAFGDDDMAILCPYDTGGLDSDVVAHAHCTHPTIVSGPHRENSPHYEPPLDFHSHEAWPLAPSPPGAAEMAVTPQLGVMRRFIRHHAADALRGERLTDLLLAANEAASNTLAHGGAPGTVRIWRDDNAVICEVSDHGVITEPLAGRVMPRIERLDGRGLWLVNQVCDLVQLRSGAPGTVLRMHMRTG